MADDILQSTYDECTTLERDTAADVDVLPARMDASGEPLSSLDDVAREERVDHLDDVGRKVIKVAASTVLASTLASALAEPPHVEMMSLSDPAPIVRVYQAIDHAPLVDEDEDEQDDETSRWRRLLKALKYLMVALALLASIALGLLKGCAGLIAAPLLPHEDERQEQSSTQSQTQTEDERGVAVAG